MEKDRSAGESGGVPHNVYQQIQTMTVAEKVKFALHAGKEARSILIKDSSRQVALSVLNSPRITEEEILVIAQSRNVSDDILRTISTNRNWVKNYAICYALTSNPKTPLIISQSCLFLLRNKEISALAKSRNVSEALRNLAQRLIRTRLKEE